MNNHPQTTAFAEHLRHLREDTGAMADLRCALIPAKEFRAWPYIAAFFPLEDDRQRTIGLLGAAAFGYLPEDAPQDQNMGDVMRQIVLGTEGKEGLTTFATRFMRLLACDSPMELAPHLRSIFNTARSKGISLNHETLVNDLMFWGDKVKRRWAAHYHRKPEQEG